MASEHNKTAQQIVEEQLDFFRRNFSGCAFAAHAARNPDLYGWGHHVIGFDELEKIDKLVHNSIEDQSVSTLSLIFPDITTDGMLDELIPALIGPTIFLHEKHDNEENRCYRLRAKIGTDESYISGFGPFPYMPVTRAAPYTSIVFRVAPRPDYDWHLKEPVEGIIHVADMDMKGLPDRTLKRMWNNSFLRTAGLLGKKPNEESAAKTTFVIPLDRANRICL